MALVPNNTHSPSLLELDQCIASAQPARRRRAGAGLLVGILLAGVVAGCGDDDDDSATPAATANAIDITVKEWTVTSSSATAKAGSVTINATNAGTVEHELIIYKTDLPASELPVVDNRVPEDDPTLEVVDEISEFAAGSKSSGTFELAAGRYLLLCNIALHYGQGMVTELVVS